MKYFILSLSLIFCSFTYAGTSPDNGVSLWKNSDIAGKVTILETYKKFFIQNEKIDFNTVSIIERDSIFQLFGAAWASDTDTCLYAGWPSVLVGEKCTSPIKNNPNYDKGTCGANQMQCQPLLFGKNICAPIGSLQEKQLAFSNCNKKFNELGRSTKDIVKEILKNGKEEKKLMELLTIADRICKTGNQASTGMCKMLLANLEKVKKATLEEGTRSAIRDLNGAQGTVISAGDIPKPGCPVLPPIPPKTVPPLKVEKKVVIAPSTKGIVLGAVSDVEAPKVPTAPPIPTATSGLLPFERLNSRISGGCGGSKPSSDGYDETYEFDCKGTDQVPSGFAFNNGPGNRYLDGAKSLYPDGGTPVRHIDFTSKDRASNETSIYLEDLAGGPDSHDVKSVMVLLPRKGVPTVETVGENVIVTLTTGEKVVFDKKSHTIKSGALSEGPIDLTTDRFKRTPPNVKYTGAGISIRVDHRYLYPTEGAETAEIRQGGRVCKIPRTKIWDATGSLISKDDNSFVDTLNQSCPPKASEVAFHL